CLRERWLVARVQESPPSSERYRPPSSASIRAYTRRLSEGATATPILPHGRFLGSPFPLSSFQVSPPSRETKRPPSPAGVLELPLSRYHGRRTACHRPAKSTLGLAGSKHTSDAPVCDGVLNFCNTGCQFLPPSLVR